MRQPIVADEIFGSNDRIKSQINESKSLMLCGESNRDLLRVKTRSSIVSKNNLNKFKI